MLEIKKYGAIDIGSNAMRLLIASVTNQNEVVHIHKLSLVRIPIRLGEDVFLNGKISSENEDNLLKAINA